MKKVLSAVAALGLVAVAANAMAADVKISGSYTVEGIYNSSADGSGSVDLVDNGNNSSDSWYMHTFNINPVIKVNDKITMKSEIRLADNTVWGKQTGGDLNFSTTQTDSNGDTVADTTSDVYVHRIFMDWKSPMGKVRVGRVPAGPYGGSTGFLDNDIRENRIMWWPSFLKSGPWSVLLDVVKDTENEATGNGTDDIDKYDARVYYKTKDLYAGLRVNVMNGTTHDQEKVTYFGFADWKTGNYFVNFEFAKADGDASATVDYDSLAYILQAGGNFDNLTADLMYFYAEGDAAGSTTEVGNALGGNGTGQLFEPLYILTGRTTGMLNPDVNGVNPGAFNMTRDGVQAIVLSADYTVSDRMTLHGALGWAEADEVQTAGQDDEYGWEFNVGAAYKLLDNLTYEAHFGYFDTGDYFKSGNAATQTEEVYLLTHALTMTF